MVSKPKKSLTSKAHENSLASLKNAGLKVTKARLSILDTLIQNHGPSSVDEIYDEVKKQKIDRVTVYRSLSSLHEKGIVRRCDLGEGAVRFEYQGVGAHHHHHIVCRRCREVKDLNECLVEEIETALKKSGYRDITHSLEFFGTCAKC